MGFNRRALFAAASGVTIFALAAPAYAQSGEENDIIVTAQRRATNLQDTPISVTSVNAEALEAMGVEDTNSLTLATPSLAFNRQATFGAQIYLRGVGSISANAGQESAVAMYVDDVYIGMPDPVQFSFNNISSVEVLKGPQGTLFGRNATGGVIHVHTRAPSHAPAADVQVGYANFDTVDASFYGTTGLTDELAANVALVWRDQKEGYGRNLTTGDDTQLGESFGARVSALWTPTASTTLRLIGDYSTDQSDFGGNPSVYPGTLGSFGVTPAGAWNTRASPSDAREMDQYGFSAKLDQEIGDLNFVSISAWREASSLVFQDQDIGAAPIIAVTMNSLYESVSQEFQLQSPDDGRFTWLLGAYYFHLNGSQDPFRTVAGGNTIDTIGTQEVDSISVFGEGTLALTDQTNLTLGARYTEDDFSVDTRRLVNGALAPGSDLSGQRTFDAVTYRAIVDHHFTDDIMGYVSFSRGFKSGGWTLAGIYNQQTLPAFQLAEPVRPEILDAWEVGVRSEFFDHRLRLNASAFDYDYTDLQVSYILAGVSVALNAAEASIRGGEVQLDFLPDEHWTFSANASVLDGEYVSFPNGPLTLPNPATCGPPPATTGPATGGNLQCFVDLAGNDTVRTPPLTATLTASYEQPTAFGAFTYSGTVYYNDGFYWEADNRIQQDAYTVLSGSVRWTAPSERWDITLWGRNLTDELYYSTVVESVIRDSSVAAAPRTYGVTLGVHF